MADNNATILIPDISGFTEFMTTTELDHASHAIHLLIDAILEAVGETYEVSEIEGDAVLLIKKGKAPSQKEILDTCLTIFNAFHFRRKWMQQYAVCPCGACQSIINLTLKFVAHHGPLAEIKVGRFVKQSGPEMIVAHRLLKNSINNNEYLLLTEKLLQQSPESPGPEEWDWIASSEEYPSIGKIAYRFALLTEARKKTPEPPQPQIQYRTDNTSWLEIVIAGNYRDVYMTVMSIPGRPSWVPGLQQVEQDRPEVFIGSIHCCSFDKYEAIVSPLKMVLTEEGVEYAESCAINEMNISLVYEFAFKKLNETSCSVATRFMNAAASPLPAAINNLLFSSMKEMAEALRLQF